MGYESCISLEHKISITYRGTIGNYEGDGESGGERPVWSMPYPDYHLIWIPLSLYYSSGTSSNKSDTGTPRAFASRSSVVVFTPLKGSLHILLIVKKDTSEALDKLDILNPLDSAISFTLRRIILLPFGSMVCQL